MRDPVGRALDAWLREAESVAGGARIDRRQRVIQRMSPYQRNELAAGVDEVIEASVARLEASPYERERDRLLAVPDGHTPESFEAWCAENSCCRHAAQAEKLKRESVRLFEAARANLSGSALAAEILTAARMLDLAHQESAACRALHAQGAPDVAF